jgi:hypothetical protein
MLRDFEDSTLWLVSSFERMRAETGNSGFARLNAGSVLPSTLTAELTQLGRERRSGGVLDVVAACIRQRESALILLRHRGLVWPLTVFPNLNLHHLPRPITSSLEQSNLDLQVIGVEPPGLRPPNHVIYEPISEESSYRPLHPLLWVLAQHAPSAQLVEDIAGRAAYRVAADFTPDAVAIAGALGPALRRLRTEIASLPDIARWPGMDRERATRLLNGVYLQGGLMVLRSHHAARDPASPVSRLRGLLPPPR